MQHVYWLLLFILLLIIEVATLGLTTIWFAAGSLFAFLANILGAGLWVQIGLFLAVSILLLVLTRPMALKYFNNNRQSTNAESVIGRQGVVLETIDTLNGKGLVAVDGENWSARTEAPVGLIPKHTIISVEGIQGVKLIVKEKEDKTSWE